MPIERWHGYCSGVQMPRNPTRAKTRRTPGRAGNHTSRSEAEQLSQFIGEIYDAALDPQRWCPVLEQTCRFVRGVDASIMSHDASQQSGAFFFSWGADAARYKLYVEEYVKINPLTRLYQTAEIGECYSAGTLMPYEEMRASRFYKEWARPQGYVDLVGATLDKLGTSLAQIVVSRHERHGVADAGARQRLALLVPHFRRAILIGEVVELHKVEAAMLADTLDGLAAGLLLVDARGRVIHANASGQAMLAEADVVSMSRGVLIAADRDADRVLSAVWAAAGGGDAQVGTSGIDISLRSRAGERHVAHVLPLTSRVRRAAGTSYHAAAAVFVRKAALPMSSRAEMLVKLYKLTPRELRVLHLVVEIGGVSAIAAALGLSDATVKTHLQHLFEKTGTARQADLVKLVATHASPFEG
jgi:DNA-binding NarL/FixJ family response regulator